MTRGAAVDPGALRHELLLQQATRAPDGLGGFAETWVTIATVFARIEPLRVSQAFTAAQEIETATHAITIRQRADIASGMRFAKGARRFRIITVRDPQETGRFIICTTEELP